MKIMLVKCMSCVIFYSACCICIAPHPKVYIIRKQNEPFTFFLEVMMLWSIKKSPKDDKRQYGSHFGFLITPLKASPDANRLFTSIYHHMSSLGISVVCL